MNEQEVLVQIVINYIHAIEAGWPPGVIAGFYDSDEEQVEFPNLLTKSKLIRNTASIIEAYEKESQLMQHQSFEIVKTLSQGNTVFLEAVWTGTLAIPIGQQVAGAKMRAFFAQVFEFKGDKIHRQRNYDCFEPFA